MKSTFLVRFVGAAALLALGWVGYTQTPPAPVPFKLVKVADDLFVIDGGGAGNVAVYVTNEGLILVDDKFDRNFGEIMENVRKVSPLPIKYIINTHYHADHSGGNTNFTYLAQIISTSMARENILKHVQPGSPDNMVPAGIVFDQQMSVFLGGKEVRAMHLGRGHTGTDAFVYFPARRVLHSGDMVTGGLPLIDYGGGGSIVEWTKTLDKALTVVPWDTIIPGHGPVSPKEMMITYKKNAEDLRNNIQAQVKAGKSEAELAAFLNAQYKWGPESLQVQMGAVKGLMAELR